MMCVGMRFLLVGDCLTSLLPSFAAAFFYRRPLKDCLDAPQGYAPAHPGRHAAAYWSVSMAKRCLREGVLGSVYIFLHDVNRPLESEIADRILKGNGGILIGTIKGPAGTLVGFKFV